MFRPIACVHTHFFFFLLAQDKRSTSDQRPNDTMEEVLEIVALGMRIRCVSPPLSSSFAESRMRVPIAYTRIDEQHEENRYRRDEKLTHNTRSALSRTHRHLGWYKRGVESFVVWVIESRHFPRGSSSELF